MKILKFTPTLKSFTLMSWLKKPYIILLLCILVTFALTHDSKSIAIVFGHAVPDKYTLKPNSLIETQQVFPSNISILFSERPDSNVSYIHVIDSTGQRIDNDDFKISDQSGKEGSVSIDRNLIEEGVYSISWLTLSLDDGHVAKGTYVVGVGNFGSLEAASRNISENNDIFSPILAVMKAPVIIGQVFILGFVLLQIFLWNNPNRIQLRGKVEFLLMPRFTKLIMVFSIVMAIAITFLPLFQAAVVTEAGSSYARNLSLLLFETVNGTVWFIRVISSVAITCITYFYGRVISKNHELNGPNKPHNDSGAVLLYILLTLICIFIGTNSFVSHSSSLQSWSLVGIIFDFIHSIAVSIWIGGLMYISYVFFPNVNSITTIISEKIQQFPSHPKSITLLILAKFSLVSTISIGIIGITGLSLAWLHIRTADELLISDYGRVLIIKLCIALPVVLMGVYHQLWICRMLNFLGIKKIENRKSVDTRFSQKKLDSIKLTIKIETLLMICTLCAASLLTVTSTPDLMDHEIIHGATSEEHLLKEAPGEFTRTLEVQGVPIGFVISPFFVGFNNFTVNILGENQNLTQTSDVFIEFKKGDLSLGPIIANLERTNNTAYSTFGGYLSQAGEWDLKITIQRINSYDLNYRLGVMVNRSGTMVENDSNYISTSKNSDPMNVPSDFTNIALLLSIVLAALSGFLYVRGLRRLAITQRNLGLR